MTTRTILDAALEVLNTADAAEKARKSQNFARMWRSGELSADANAVTPPLRPARPDEPQLCNPGSMKKRKLTTEAGRISMLHALAHIELNAIDLAWDIIARFWSSGMPRAFVDDWVLVADEEGKHFLLLIERLKSMGSYYGALPAHDGLWESALITKDDLLGRLAVVPLVLEARGLDVTPMLIEKLKNVGDLETAEIMNTIYQDEIGHVAIGKRWFDHFCQQQNCQPIPTYHAMVNQYFKGILKRPFNEVAREQAGFSTQFYLPLAK